MLYIPSFEIASTLDSPTNPAARYVAVIRDYRNVIRIQGWPGGLASWSLTNVASQRWEDIIYRNSAQSLWNATPTYLNQQQTTALIDSALGSRNFSSETVVGATALSYDPIAPNYPIAVSTSDPQWLALIAGSSGVASFNGRTGIVVPQTNDYTWAQINKATSSLADITTRSASDLSSGTLPDARFPATLPTLNGSLLTNLNGSAITSGTIPDARINAVLTGPTGAQTVTGAFGLTQSNAGSFFWNKGQGYFGSDGNATTNPLVPLHAGPYRYVVNVQENDSNAGLSTGNPDILLNVLGGVTPNNSNSYQGINVNVYDNPAAAGIIRLLGGEISSWWAGSVSQAAATVMGAQLFGLSYGNASVLGIAQSAADSQSQDDTGLTGILVQTQAYQGGARTVGYQRGINVSSGIQGVANVTTDDTIFIQPVFLGTGTVGYHRGINIFPALTEGLGIGPFEAVVQTLVGLEIQDQTLFPVGSTPGSVVRNPNPWNMRSLGVTARNLFAGPIVLGVDAGPRVVSSEGTPVSTPTVGSLNLDSDTGLVTRYAGSSYWSAFNRSPVNAQVGTSYTLRDIDGGRLVTFNNGSAIAVTLPAAGTVSTVTDNFNRANGALGANWGDVATYVQAIIDTNTFAGATSSNRAARYIGDSFRLNQSSQATLVSVAQRIWVLARVIDPDTVAFAGKFTFYFAGSSQADQGNINYYIGKSLNNNITVLQTTATAALINDVVKLEAVGGSTTTLNLYVNGALLTTVNDTVDPIVTDGSPGLLINTATATIDGWDSFVATGAMSQPVSVFGDGWYVDLKDLGAGTVTITPTTSTIDGGATKTIATNKSLRVVSNGTDYQTLFAN